MAECLLILLRIRANESEVNELAAVISANFIMIDTLFQFGSTQDDRERKSKAKKTIDSVWRFNHYNNKTISPDKNDLLKREIKDLTDNYLSLEHENLLDLKFAQDHFKAETKKNILIISDGKVFENEELFSKHFDLITNKFIEALEIRTVRGLNED